jgi:hypothetical protein
MDRTLWLRPSLASTATPARADHTPDPLFVVVDELEGQVATLIVEPWPEVDGRGRLRFGNEEDRKSFDVDLGTLSGTLSKRRYLGDDAALPEQSQLAERPIRPGDTFAVFTDPPKDGEKAAELLESWATSPIIDVSAQARHAAKGQYFAAVGPVLKEAQVTAIANEFYNLDADQRL